MHNFYISTGHDEKCLSSMNLVVPLQCSLNMLEGDTGYDITFFSYLCAIAIVAMFRHW